MAETLATVYVTSRPRLQTNVVPATTRTWVAVETEVETEVDRRKASAVSGVLMVVGHLLSTTVNPVFNGVYMAVAVLSLSRHFYKPAITDWAESVNQCLLYLEMARFALKGELFFFVFVYLLLFACICLVLCGWHTLMWLFDIHEQDWKRAGEAPSRVWKVAAAIYNVSRIVCL